MRVVVALAITAVCASAHADPHKSKPPPPPKPDVPHVQAPWEVGVSADRQAQANALFAEGNELFAQQAHAPALEKYNAAIAIWDHPMIRFNIAVTLIRLDRILEASDQLDAALRFGAQPFTPELHQQALDYQRLVSGRLGTIAASCTQDNAHVLLDGKPWFDCPGGREQRVISGEHALVAEKKGFMTVSRRLVVAGNGTAREKLSLLPIESVTKLEYPTARWIPWSVAGSGLAIALGGVAFWASSRNQMDRFQAQFATECPTGCESDLSMHPSLAAERSSARLKGTIGGTLMIGGGVIAASGLVWGLVLNRPHRITPAVEISPTAGGVATSARWRF